MSKLKHYGNQLITNCFTRVLLKTEYCTKRTEQLQNKFNANNILGQWEHCSNTLTKKQNPKTTHTIKTGKCTAPSKNRGEKKSPEQFYNEQINGSIIFKITFYCIP